MVSSAGNALSLIKAVLELVADRRTGVLDVRSDGLRTQIYFDDGKPLFARTRRKTRRPARRSAAC